MTMRTEESEFITWAEAELRRAGWFDEDSDYNGLIGEEVLKVCRTFSEAGHSGFSAAVTTALFERLASRRALSSLTDDPDEWMHIDENSSGEPNLWQNRRQGSCFSHDGGKSYHDIDEVLPWWKYRLHHTARLLKVVRHRRPWIFYPRHRTEHHEPEA